MDSAFINPPDSMPALIPFRLSQRRGGGYAAALETLVDCGILIRAGVRQCGKTSMMTYRYSDKFREALYNAFDPCI